MRTPRTCQPAGRLVGLLLLPLLSLAGSAPAHAVLLRYRPAVGETARYKLSLAGRMQISAESQQAAAVGEKVEMTASIEYAQKALSETEDTVVVETRLISGEAKVTTDGSTESADLGTVRAETTADRRREAGESNVKVEEDFGELSGPAAHALENFGLSSGGWLDLVDVLYFPEGEVEVGGSWRYQPPDDSPGERYAIEYRLLELTTRAGHKCAKIGVSWRNTFSEAKPPEGQAEDDPQAVVTNAVLVAEYVCCYDYEKSLDIHLEGCVGSSITVSMSPHDVGSFKDIVNLKLDLVE